MARIVVYSMAYRGDVHPYASIASGLVERGHDVTFVVPREFHEEFAAEPFRCVHSGTDFSPSALDEHGEWLAKWGMKFGGVRILDLFIGQLTVPHLATLFDHLEAELAGADLLVTHSTACLVGSIVAEATDVPWISADLFPMLLPSDTAPPAAGMPNLGPTANSALWKLASSKRLSARLAFGNEFSAFRRSKGVDDTLTSITAARISPHLNLGLMSPHYLAPAHDWPANYHLTGFTHWAGAAAMMPPGIEQFLDDGDAPVLVTFGTLAAASHPERFDAAIAAVERMGYRALVLASNEANTARLAQHRARGHGVWRYAPLAQLLGRCRAVVHSGSLGTTTMSLAAGLPAVAMPAIFDQVWHGQRLEDLGVGVMARRPSQLADAVTRVVTDRAMAAEAGRLGSLISAEDGLGATLDRIDGFLANPSAPPAGR